MKEQAHTYSPTSSKISSGIATHTVLCLLCIVQSIVVTNGSTMPISGTSELPTKRKLETNEKLLHKTNSNSNDQSSNRQPKNQTTSVTRLETSPVRKHRRLRTTNKMIRQSTSFYQDKSTAGTNNHNSNSQQKVHQTSNQNHQHRRVLSNNKLGTEYFGEPFEDGMLNDYLRTIHEERNDNANALSMG